jgi:iron complex transport system substrate-binding protein
MVNLLAALLLWPPPGRIVSTAPAATEILFALGLGPRVVGVTQFCNYPPEARAKPRVGTFLQPNIEVILRLKPDLVVIQKNPVRLGERLESMGLKTIEVDQPTVEAVFDSIRRIGAAAGAPERAAALERQMRAELEAIRRKVAGRAPPRAVFIVGRNPNAIEGLVAVGQGAYLNELMALAGGRNIFGDAGAPYPRIGLEEVLARNPEVVIDMGDMASTQNVTDQQTRAVVALWNRYPSLAAVKNRRVFAVASDIFVVPGPRIVDAAREFARMFHPEAAW